MWLGNSLTSNGIVWNFWSEASTSSLQVSNTHDGICTIRTHLLVLNSPVICNTMASSTFSKIAWTKYCSLVYTSSNPSIKYYFTYTLLAVVSMVIMVRMRVTWCPVMARRFLHLPARTSTSFTLLWIVVLVQSLSKYLMTALTNIACS